MTNTPATSTYTVRRLFASVKLQYVDHAPVQSACTDALREISAQYGAVKRCPAAIGRDLEQSDVGLTDALDA
jgi:hypothetical protein